MLVSLFQFVYSIAEYSVENSLIKPTYMLTYESATELLHLNLKEEAELRLLSEAAALRHQWRMRQVGLKISHGKIIESQGYLGLIVDNISLRQTKVSSLESRNF